MENVTLTRRELYDMAWSAPFSTLCKKYQISDVGLRKACVRMAIPLPGIGHWNKVHAGKKVDIKPFKENAAVEQSLVLTLATNEKDAGKDLPTELALLQAAIEADPAIDLVVKNTLANPDPLIVSAQKALNKRDKYYREGNLLYAGEGNLRIRVTPPLLDRALCFMDTFVKAMRQRGHIFKVTDRGSYVVFGDDELEMTLMELHTRTPVAGTYPSTESHPNGKLCLKFKRWSIFFEIKDGKTPIEQQLARIIAKLEIQGEEFRKEAIEREQRHKREEEQRLIKAAFDHRKKLELSSMKQAIKDANLWQKAMQLKSYIAYIEKKENLSEELSLWLDWIKKKADWLDPTTEGEDEWLTDRDKDNLLTGQEEQPSYFSYFNYPIKKEKKAWPRLPWYSKKV